LIFFAERMSVRIRISSLISAWGGDMTDFGILHEADSCEVRPVPACGLETQPAVGKGRIIQEYGAGLILSFGDLQFVTHFIQDGLPAGEIIEVDIQENPTVHGDNRQERVK